MRALTLSVLLIAWTVAGEEQSAQSPIEFVRADLKIKGSAPWAASAGDFNADRLPDFAISNRESRDITVLTAQLFAPNPRFKPLWPFRSTPHWKW